MAKQPASRTRIWLGRFALGGDLSQGGVEVSQELAVVTALADAGPRRVVGNYDHRLPFLGFLEPTDDGYDEQIHALLESSADHYLTYAIGSAGAPAIGDVAYDAVVALEAAPRSAQLGGAVLLNFDGVGRNALSRGVVLGSKTSTGAENLAGVNMGATTSGRTLRAIFRLLAFTGTNITLKLQESQNDGSPDLYADIAGLTSGALTGPNVVAATTTAATEAWKRLAISGTFSSALIVVSAGVLAGE